MRGGIAALMLLAACGVDPVGMVDAGQEDAGPMLVDAGAVDAGCDPYKACNYCRAQELSDCSIACWKLCKQVNCTPQSQDWAEAAQCDSDCGNLSLHPTRCVVPACCQ
jgi:hypothetical protein